MATKTTTTTTTTNEEPSLAEAICGLIVSSALLALIIWGVITVFGYLKPAPTVTTVITIQLVSKQPDKYTSAIVQDNNGKIYTSSSASTLILQSGHSYKVEGDNQGKIYRVVEEVVEKQLEANQ